MVLYKRKEAAKMLRIHVNTLDNLVKTGKIDSTLIGSSRMFFDYHLLNYAKKNEINNY